jgi:hypothetical protein
MQLRFRAANQSCYAAYHRIEPSHKDSVDA